MLLNFIEEPCFVTSNDFIFSNNTKPRLLRHLIFWIIFALYIFLFRFYLKDQKEMFEADTYLKRLKGVLLFLPVSFFYAYFALYYLLPNYILKGRYIPLLILLALLSLLLLFVSYLVSPLFDIRTVWDIPAKRDEMVREIDFTINNVLVYPLTVSGFAIGIKMAKNWHLKQKENEELARLKIKTEVRLLKTQIHPQFLFNSLNSIYKNALAGSAQSPGMLLKLSDLLSYILYESDTELVALEKELTIINEYIDLEKTSFGEALHITVHNTALPSGKLIAPLILLPVLEFIFEQEYSSIRYPLSLTVNIQLKENLFYFTITFSGEPAKVQDAFAKKAGLLQVQKRLESLYPKKHGFEVMCDATSLVISLNLLLEEVRSQGNHMTVQTAVAI